MSNSSTPDYSDLRTASARAIGWLQAGDAARAQAPESSKTWLWASGLAACSMVAAGAWFAFYVVDAPNPSSAPGISSSPSTVLSGPQFSQPDSEATGILANNRAAAKAAFVPGMTGMQISSDLNTLAAAAKDDNNAKLAFELGQRLRACAPEALQKRLANAGDGQVHDRDALGYVYGTREQIEQQHREACNGLAVAHISQADELLAIAHANKLPAALVDTAVQQLGAVEAAAAMYRAQNPGWNLNPNIGNGVYVPPGAAQPLAELARQAELGNTPAMKALADAYAKGLVVPQNDTTAMVYQLVGGASWEKPETQFDQHRLLADVSPRFKANVVREATQLFKSCCSGKNRYAQIEPSGE